MLSLPGSVRVFVARERVDFRKGIDGLYAVVRDHFREDALSGHLYLFFNRRRDRLKILVWDRNGFWLFLKRLECGTFERVEGTSERVEGTSDRVEIDRARLAMLLDGIDTKNARMRKHFAREIRLMSRDGVERAGSSP